MTILKCKFDGEPKYSIEKITEAKDKMLAALNSWGYDAYPRKLNDDLTFEISIPGKISYGVLDKFMKLFEEKFDVLSESFDVNL